MSNLVFCKHDNCVGYCDHCRSGCNDKFCFVRVQSCLTVNPDVHFIEQINKLESENKRLREALEKIAKDRVRVEYRHIDDAVFDLTSAARIAISALEGKK